MNENANKILVTTNGEAMIPNWVVERYTLEEVTSLYIYIYKQQQALHIYEKGSISPKLLK